MSYSNVIPFPSPSCRPSFPRALGPRLVRRDASQALPANLLWMPPAPPARSLWPARAVQALRRECGRAVREYSAAMPWRH